MDKALMQKKYGKLQSFTYPGRFHKYHPEKITELVSKSDFDLTLNDLSSIFSMQEPDADYEEGLYYIPLCFEKMREACPLERNVCVSLFWYIEFFKDKLDKDGFYNDCIREIENYLEMVTSDFRVIKEYQPSARYCLSKLEYGLTVESIVFGAADSDETWKILSPFLFTLKDKGSIGSCWWLMVSYFVRYEIMHAERRDYQYKKRKILFEHFHKFGAYAEHFKKARIYLQEMNTYDFLPQFAIVPFSLAEKRA